MKLLPILAKFPKWGIAGGTIVISSAIFIGWWMFRSPQQDPKTPPVQAQAAKPILDFDPKDVVLCGNTLVNYHTGEILAKQWLEGAGDNSPPIAGIFPDEKLVIVENRGMALAFGFDGKPKPLLAYDGKPLGASAFSNERPDVIFVRDGNLWRGKPDWVNSTVNDAKRITDVGYFRNDVFTSEWFWAGDTLYVSVLGQPHRVSLTEGKITPDRIPIRRLIKGVSPDRKLTIFGSRPREFQVADLQNGSSKSFRTVGDAQEVLWLTPTRAAVLAGNRVISIYDHERKDIVGHHDPNVQITDLLSCSPDGKFVIVRTTADFRAFSAESGEFTRLTLPVIQSIWGDNETLLCSDPGTDSEMRGVWLLKMDGTKERISNQPIDSVSARGQGASAVSIADGILYVCGGNLRRFVNLEKSVSQVSHDQTLDPNLKKLAEN